MLLCVLLLQVLTCDCRIYVKRGKHYSFVTIYYVFISFEHYLIQNLLFMTGEIREINDELGFVSIVSKRQLVSRNNIIIILYQMYYIFIATTRGKYTL